MIVVLDTNVVVTGLRSPGGLSASLLKMVLMDRLQILLSVPLGIEYEAVAVRPEHILAAKASQAQMLNAIDALIGKARPVELHYQWRPQLRDAADEIVLEAAVNGQADAIVTYNVRDFGAVPESFGVDVITPAQLLERIGHHE